MTKQRREKQPPPGGRRAAKRLSDGHRLLKLAPVCEMGGFSLCSMVLHVLGTSDQEKVGLVPLSCRVLGQSWHASPPSSVQSAPWSTPSCGMPNCVGLPSYPETAYNQCCPYGGAPQSASCPNSVSAPCFHTRSAHIQPAQVALPEEGDALQCSRGRTAVCHHCCCTNVRDASPVTCRSPHSFRGVPPAPETLCGPHFVHPQTAGDLLSVANTIHPRPVASPVCTPDPELVQSPGNPPGDYDYESSRGTSQWQAHEGDEGLPAGARRGPVTPRALRLRSFDPKDYK